MMNSRFHPFAVSHLEDESEKVGSGMSTSQFIASVSHTMGAEEIKLALSSHAS